MYIPIEDWIQQISATIAHFNLSMTAVAGIAFVLFIALLFALREAASWFFKIDDLKRELRKMNRMVIDLESEVRALHGLIESSKGREHTSIHTPSMSPPLSPPLSSLNEKTPTEKSVAFPISH